MGVHRLCNIRSLQEKRGWGSYGGHSFAHNFVLVVIDYCINVTGAYLGKGTSIGNFSRHEI